MANPRFFSCHGPFTVAQLLEFAEAADLTLSLAGQADEARIVQDVAPLGRATGEDLSFLDNRKYRDVLRVTQAGVCLLREGDVALAPDGMSLLVTDYPYAAYALLAQHFYPDACTLTIPVDAGVSERADIADGVQIAPSAVVAEHAQIGSGSIIGPHSVVGPGVVIGQGCHIGAGCVITHAVLGNRVMLNHGVKIGQDGFGFAPTAKGFLKVPQLGTVQIGDDVEIGANSTIDRGAGPDTVIGTGCKLDNLVQIGHNVEIGPYTVIAAQSGVAGSSRIGAGTMIGGQVGVSGHLSVGNKVQIAAQSGISQDVVDGMVVGGTPAVPIRHWHKQQVVLKKLIDTKRTAD